MDDITKIVLTEAAKQSLKLLLKSIRRKDDTVSPDLIEARLQQTATTVACVKTLLSTDRSIPISQFYCSPRVSTGAKIFFPKSADAFREDHVMIEGIAGQGKSTLLRFLCADAILNKGRIAFFYELRRMDHSKPLIRIVLDSLSDLGLGSKQETLRKLSVERGAEIYLDGYDELTQKEAVKVERDISTIVSTYPFTRLFVSSRPHAGLGLSSDLTTYRIEPLNQQDGFRIIDKLLSEQLAVAAELKKKLQAHTGQVGALLETPLLVTLLVARYAQTREIPEQLTDFYKSIFDTLFERHDHFKAPFRRSRRIQMNSYHYLIAFQKFCFGSLLATQLSDETAIKLSEWAMAGLPSTGPGMDFLNDISETTALLLHDDHTWSFIHSSIQEYHAASELLSLTDSEITSNAAKLASMKNRGSRDQVFQFAQEIDNFRYTSFIAIPYFKEALRPLTELSQLGTRAALDWLKVRINGFRLNKLSDPDGKFITLYTDRDDMRAIQVFIRNDDFDRLSEAFSSSSSIIECIEALLSVPYAVDRIASSTLKYLEPVQSRLRDELSRHGQLALERQRSLPDLMKILSDAH